MEWGGQYYELAVYGTSIYFFQKEVDYMKKVNVFFIYDNVFANTLSYIKNTFTFFMELIIERKRKKSI